MKTLHRGLHLTIAALIALPVITVFFAWFQPDPELWTHFAETLLSEMLVNSLLLCLAVAAGCLLLGTSLAWLVSRYDFAGRRWMQWALVLPFALPPYVLAFVYLGLFNYAGPLQSWLQGQFGMAGMDIRESRTVIAGIFTLVFFPYVYLPARVAFLTQSSSYDEAAASFGYSLLRRLWCVTLPLARPALAGGALLAVMETLADFGVVAMFNYNHPLQVDHVVDARGSAGDITSTTHTLINNLLQSRMIRPSPYGGIECGFETGQVVSERDRHLQGLFALGPITSGTYFFTTALEIIERQAKERAQDLSFRLAEDLLARKHQDTLSNVIPLTPHRSTSTVNAPQETLH